MANPFYIKIRYRGKLHKPEDVQQLILETEDICRTNGWTHTIWEEDWSEPQSVTLDFSDGAMNFGGHAPLKGITFNFDKSEMVWLTFLPDGTLNSLFTLTNPTFFGNDEAFPWQRVKTGFDGATTHLALCKLFRYLAGKYFEVFEVLDESGYWEHGDDAKFTKWIDNQIHDHRIMDEELEAIKNDDSLNPLQKRDKSFKIIKELGEKTRKKE